MLDVLGVGILLRLRAVRFQLWIAKEGPNGPRFVKDRCQTVGAGPYRREKGFLDSSILIATSSGI
jgi:hypothetical protein